MTYQHITSRTNRDGTERFYFRKRGRPLVRLPGTPGTYAFERAYEDCLQELESQRVSPDATLAGYRMEWAKKLFVKIQNRANHQYKDTACELSMFNLIDMMELQRDRRALSGRRFRYIKPNNLTGRDPYAPSVDRINSSGDYKPDNCRMVLLAVNIALNEWSDDEYIKICSAVTRVAQKARRP